jgi:putative hemin transport protein
MTDSTLMVRAAFAAMRRDGPRRHRDIAKILSISEAELLAAHCGHVPIEESSALEVKRLKTQWAEQIASMTSFGSVMALTRNASCVHEKIGVYAPVSQTGEIGIVQGEAIDLRIFYQHWHLGFAVSEKTARGVQRSLQFFDRYGVAVHKIFLRSESQVTTFDLFKENFADEVQLPQVSIQGRFLASPARSDSEIDMTGLKQEWSSMRDTHDFFILLKKYSATRLQAFRLIGANYAQTVRPIECRRILSIASEKKIPIMVFVSNPGVIQIHSGVVTNISVAKGWINVLDADFNLHLRQDQIASAWVVRKPTVDGVVTSLELFDQSGELILMLFGQRKPGIPENIQWRAMLDSLTAGSRLCAA